MKQQAPKTLPQKAETIENTRKTADILIGAACHKTAVFQVKYGDFSIKMFEFLRFAHLQFLPPEESFCETGGYYIHI